MGMVVSFTRVTSEEWARIQAAPGVAGEILDARPFDDDGEPSGYIDKAWGGLEYLLERAKIDVDLFFDGDLIDHESMLYAWSPDLVRSTAERLRATPFAKLAEYFDAQAMDDSDVYPTIWVRDGNEESLEYLRLNYEDLVRFFEFAASSDSGAVMSFG